MQGNVDTIPNVVLHIRKTLPLPLPLFLAKLFIKMYLTGNFKDKRHRLLTKVKT